MPDRMTPRGETRQLGNVLKNDGALLDESARRNGTFLFVVHRRVTSSRTDAALLCGGGGDPMD